MDCVAQVNATSDPVTSGTSADIQRHVFDEAVKAGADKHSDLWAVVKHLEIEFQADL